MTAPLRKILLKAFLEFIKSDFILKAEVLQHYAIVMTDAPVYSPDGKFMWIGNEWIPAPPASEPLTSPNNDQKISMQDSVIGGDVVSNTVINNDPAAVTTAVITALQQLGLLGENTPQQAPPAPEIELPQSFQVGDHVEYHSPTNARWLNRCKVVAINDDGTYRIEVPKDNAIETKLAVVIGTSPGTIRPASIPFKSGDRVFVNWKNHGHYFPGKIASENADFTFNIHFDDGDVEYNVEWERIEPLNEESKEVQDYIENESKEERELIEAFQVFDADNSGTISAREYFTILTEMGDNPVSIDDVMQEFSEMGIGLDSEIDYRSLAKYMLSSEDSELSQPKPEVVIRDAIISEGILRGYAYAHPKLGEGTIKSSAIQSVTYDSRATARVETRNTIYVVGPTGWTEKPDDHPFNSTYSGSIEILEAVSGKPVRFRINNRPSSNDAWVGIYPVNAGDGEHGDRWEWIRDIDVNNAMLPEQAKGRWSIRVFLDGGYTLHDRVDFDIVSAHNPNMQINMHPLSGKIFLLQNQYPGYDYKFVSFRTKDLAMRVIYEQHDAMPIQFVSVEGKPNTYHLLNKYKDGSEADRAYDQWISFANDGKWLFCRYREKTDAMPVLIEHVDADTIIMNNQWPGQEAFWLSFADDGKWMRVTYQKKEAMPMKLIPEYVHDNKSADSESEAEPRAKMMDAESNKRPAITALVIGIFLFVIGLTAFIASGQKNLGMLIPGAIAFPVGAFLAVSAMFVLTSSEVDR